MLFKKINFDNNNKLTEKVRINVKFEIRLNMQFLIDRVVKDAF